MHNESGRWLARAHLERAKARWSGAALLCGAIVVAVLVERLLWISP